MIVNVYIAFPIKTSGDLSSFENIKSIGDFTNEPDFNDGHHLSVFEIVHSSYFVKGSLVSVDLV